MIDPFLGNNVRSKELGREMRRLGTTLLIIALITGACSSSVKERKVSVGTGGGEYPFRGGLLVIPPGAVTDDTAFRVEAVEATIPGELGELTESAGGAVEVELGKSLRMPATLRFHVSAPPDGASEAGAIVLRSGSTTETVPATWDPSSSTLTAEVAHFSIAFPAWINPLKLSERLTGIVSRLVGETTGVSSSRPDCLGKPAVIGGSTVRIEKSPSEADSPQWPCVESANQEARVILHSSSGIPWRVRATSGGRAEPQGSASLDDATLIALWKRLAANAPFQEQVLAPGGSVSYRFPTSALPGRLEAAEDAGLYLTAVVIFSGLYLLDVFSGGKGSAVPEGAKAALDRAESLECVAKASEAAGEVSGRPSIAAVTVVARAAIGCFGTIASALGGSVSGAAKVLVAALGSGIGLAVGGLKAAFDTALGWDRNSYRAVRDRVTSEPTTRSASNCGGPNSPTAPKSPEELIHCFVRAYERGSRADARAVADEQAIAALFDELRPAGRLAEIRCGGTECTLIWEPFRCMRILLTYGRMDASFLFIEEGYVGCGGLHD